MAESKASERKRLQRREFLQKGALAGAAAIVGSTAALPADAAAQTTAPALPAVPAPTTPIMTAAGEAIGPGDVQVIGDNQRSGSDFMVDVLKSLGMTTVSV